LPPPRTGDDSTADLTGVIRARRWQLWRPRLIGLGIVAVVITLAAVAWFSPVLALEKVNVSGGELVDHDKVSDFVLDADGATPPGAASWSPPPVASPRCHGCEPASSRSPFSSSSRRPPRPRSTTRARGR